MAEDNYPAFEACRECKDARWCAENAEGGDGCEYAERLVETVLEVFTPEVLDDSRVGLGLSRKFPKPGKRPARWPSRLAGLVQIAGISEGQHMRAQRHARALEARTNSDRSAAEDDQ